jgi:hypothetical protein
MNALIIIESLVNAFEGWISWRIIFWSVWQIEIEIEIEISSFKNQKLVRHSNFFPYEWISS